MLGFATGLDLVELCRQNRSSKSLIAYLGRNLPTHVFLCEIELADGPSCFLVEHFLRHGWTDVQEEYDIAVRHSRGCSAR